MTVSRSRRPDAGEEPPEIEVLDLVTKADATFYRQQVQALERRGVAIETLAVPGRHRRSDDSGSSRSVWHYAAFYPAVLRRSFGSYDLIHANYGLTAPAALAQPNLKVVVSLWGSDLFDTFGPVSAWCARRADAVIVMSEPMARELDVDCHVIPHGVDLDRFAPTSQGVALTELGWADDAKHVLFPYATNRPEKDYPRAERVVDAVRARVDAHVELHTMFQVPHERMPVYMNAADALLLTSRHEGSPNSVKEALACNLPVVSTDVGDVRERLDGVTPGGVYRADDELVDALVSILDDGTRSNGREAVRSLSLERMGERIHEVYETVLAD